MKAISRWLLARAWFSPAVMAGMFLLVLAALLSLVRLQFMETRRNELVRTTRTARQHLDLRFQGHRDFLALLAEDIRRGDLDEASFNQRATRYVAEHPAISLISFVDADSVIRWAAPKDLGKSLVGLKQLAETQTAAQRARTSGEPAYTPPFVSIQGGTVFEVLVPVFHEGDYLGMIVGSYSAEGVLRHSLDREVFQNHRVQLVNENGAVIAGLPTGGWAVDERLVITVPLQPPGQGVHLQLARYSGSFWNWPIMFLVLLCVALVVGMAWGMWAINRQIRQRLLAEQALSEANQSLERRVQARTSDLQEANTRLQQEITERQRAERRVREHQHQLAHVTRLSTMGEMAAGLAHELNQPLGAITTFAQGCIQLLESPSPDIPEIRQALSTMASQANRAGRIIHRLREFVMDSKPQLVKSDVNALLQEITELLEPDARKANVDMAFELADSLPPALADGIQIQQVVLNLMRNSIEAMQEVHSAARQLRVVTEPVNAHIEVAVVDNGPGCSGETLRQMFDAFYTTKNSGMGMGLSISRTIIEAHGGRLWAAANDGGGLSVRFSLPIANGETDDAN